MHVILTHEQADFDAVGTLLGASLLSADEPSPLLPRRMNRNVRAFLNLYGAELPFIEARDISGGPIDTVTLVDTQSMVTLKGFSPSTQVYVIDHHHQRADLPKEWTVTIDQLGACTTLFVENLRDHNGSLSLVHATLLLLGIYEDTGSLTYSSTTPRDVRAAAYLLEQGASLKIAAEYLNPPLSPDQRKLYERLLAAVETHTILGQSVIITRAPAEELTEEISSVAHKIRDLLDPDALFLLVSTPEGIRIVARSTSDQINVARITTHFGGGGHERAAAALIRPTQTSAAAQNEKQIEAVYNELIRILPENIQPSITVRQIMSRRPLVLSPQTPAETAAQLMQKYGYEGYPVVENGKVIGLLTRRAVDRALSHKLNLTAKSLMEAGEVFVQPQDAIDSLQRLMSSSGWGQVPVIDPISGEVIGIVTRTDLFKVMAGTEAQVPGKKNLAARLEVALPPGRLALLKVIAEQAYTQHTPIYIVGGFVRDLLLERPSLDFDVVVEGDAISLGQSLASRFGGRIVSHSRFGTAKWAISDVRSSLLDQLSTHPALKTANPWNTIDLPESLDLISARTEFYDYPTALPTVEQGNIKLDLHRRDFTINTMALRLDGQHYGELYDYWGGLNDLHRGLVRVLHSLSFVDDPTRILRAVRFEQRFGFQIEARTRQLLDEAHTLLHQVSGDRLRHELDLMLSETRVGAMLARLDELGLLSAIHPELKWEPDLTRLLDQAMIAPIDPVWELPNRIGHTPVRRMLGYLVWLGRIPCKQAESIAERLRFPNTMCNPLLAACQLWNDLPGLMNARPSEITTRLDLVPRPALYAVSILTVSDDAKTLLQQYISKWRLIHPFTTGDLLQSMHVKPGPAYHQILESLRAAWLDGSVTSMEEEQTLLQQFLQTLPELD
ncbi:MAG: CBS domain-containing protein [Anaerolineaceae bacterium]|nr:CBS domain-containing protein [Anaerolineaceae bacterium]